MRRDFLELDAVFFFGVEVLLEDLTPDFFGVLEVVPADLEVVDVCVAARRTEVNPVLKLQTTTIDTKVKFSVFNEISCKRGCGFTQKTP